MDRFDRIFALHQVLQAHRYPVATKKLQEALGCSRATVMRCIEVMRNSLNAPIEYDRAAPGYYYASDGDIRFELPGLWFNAVELEALLIMQELLADVEPGLLAQNIGPLKQRIAGLLEKGGVSPRIAADRIRILSMAQRKPALATFNVITQALFARHRLLLDYHARGRGEATERTVSPQRLVRYRDNWYLDAWCHLRQGLRSFALDAIRAATPLAQPAREIDSAQLDRHFAAGYGIFAGQASHTARLRFTAERARWVATEHWHHDQQGVWLPDGRYELQIPYSDPRELLLDILKYGPDLEVIAPAELRHAVAERLRAAADQYRS